MVLSPDFKEFLKLMSDRQIEYLLIGGFAVGYHGYPRSTNGLDIWIGIDPATAQKMVSALKEFGFDTPQLSERLFLKKDTIARMGIPPVRIEILTSVSGITFEACFQNRIIDKIDGIEVNIIDLKHLKINKKASGRHKDLDDLENLP